MRRRRLRSLAAAMAVGAVLAVAAAACTDDQGAGSDAASTTTTRPRSAGAPRPVDIVNTGPWPMHHIDGRFRGANALGAADVDDDGDADYVTNYEFDQRWEVVLRPDPEEVGRAWPHVEIWRPDPLVSGNGKNPESTALGDFDGDGNVDAVGAHGFSDFAQFEGSAPGIHLVWGPGPERVSDSTAWTDGGWVPATVDLGHPHWVVAHDVDDDGLTDVVFGGRRHGGGGGYDNPDSPNGNGTLTGIAWLEAPAAPAERRDLARWQLHRIDPTTTSGHGFTFADLDGDGDDDLVDANADFDTAETDEAVFWYENPGNGSEAQGGRWRRTTLLRSPDFYAKPSVAVGDLDGDDDPDIVSQTDDALILLRNEGGRPLSFEPFEVAKPAAAAFRSRPVRLADFDGDGDLDVFGMLIHDDGTLPADKAAAFLLLNDGRPFDAAGWTLVPIKWGSGSTMAMPGFGEKWDQVHVDDVDGDGDLDVVANCEEWWASPQGEVAPFYTPDLHVASVAVVWFENVLGDQPPTAVGADGQVTVEAERPTTVGDSSWVERAPVAGDVSPPGGAAGAAGGSVVAMQALNGLPPTDGVLAADATEGVTYEVRTDTAGEHVVWARVFVPGAFTSAIGGDSADSAWLSIDDGPALVIDDEPGGPTDSWQWLRLPGTVDLTRGSHQLTLRPRERGFAVDRLVLTTDLVDRPT